MIPSIVIDHPRGTSFFFLLFCLHLIFFFFYLEKTDYQIYLNKWEKNDKLLFIGFWCLFIYIDRILRFENVKKRSTANRKLTVHFIIFPNRRNEKSNRSRYQQILRMILERYLQNDVLLHLYEITLMDVAFPRTKILVKLIKLTCHLHLPSFNHR